MNQQTYGEARKEAEERLQEVLSRLADSICERAEELQRAVQALLLGCSEMWEDLKAFIESYNETIQKQEKERRKFKPPIKNKYFSLGVKVFKSQVMNNKPWMIRIRNNC